MIKKYTKRDGSTAYMFKLYLGIDPITNKQKHTTRRGFSTIKEARTELARIQTDIANNGIKSSKKYTFKDVYDLWLESYSRSVRDSTLARVKQNFKTTILPYFNNQDITKITPVYCQKMINQWSLQYKTARDITRQTTVIFDYAVKLSIIHKNPFALTTKPLESHTVIDENNLYYTPQELETFLEHAKGEDTLTYTLFRLLAFTGLRKGELLALEWNDINLDTGILTINKTLARGLDNTTIINPPKTKDSNRKIMLDENTISSLKMWKTEQAKHLLKMGFGFSKNQLIFSNLENNSYLSIHFPKWKMDTICKSHNFKRIKIHGFRHTHCCLLLSSGISLQDVQKRLGHSDMTITLKIYTHLSEQQERQTVQKLVEFASF